MLTMRTESQGLSVLPGPSMQISRSIRGLRRYGFLLALIALSSLTVSCTRSGNKAPSIDFTRIPPADRGGPDFMDTIEGRVRGAKPGQQIVVFIHNTVWWVQPEKNEPYTAIRPDSTWSTP